MFKQGDRVIIVKDYTMNDSEYDNQEAIYIQQTNDLMYRHLVKTRLVPDDPSRFAHLRAGCGSERIIERNVYMVKHSLQQIREDKLDIILDNDKDKTSNGKND